MLRFEDFKVGMVVRNQVDYSRKPNTRNGLSSAVVAMYAPPLDALGIVVKLDTDKQRQHVRIRYPNHPCQQYQGDWIITFSHGKRESNEVAIVTDEEEIALALLGM